MFAQAKPPTTFLEWLSGRHSEQEFMLLAWSALFLLTVVAIAGYFWARIRKAEFQARQAASEASLKQDMLNRGMSADEIERVLKASK
jgi:hypothetical protein